MFMEPHVSPELGSLKEILMFAGMDVSVEKDNIYEFRLQDVLREKSFETAAKRLSFVTLNQASRALRNQLELSVFEDERVVPAELPIPWSRYRGDISVLYHSPETGAAGMLLFSEIGDSILFELAYSSSPLILAGLVEAALEIADEAFSPEQKILVPIVRDSSRQLVDKLVPNAARGEVVEAVKWF